MLLCHGFSRTVCSSLLLLAVGSFFASGCTSPSRGVLAPSNTIDVGVGLMSGDEEDIEVNNVEFPVDIENGYSVHIRPTSWFANDSASYYVYDPNDPNSEKAPTIWDCGVLGVGFDLSYFSFTAEEAVSNFGTIDIELLGVNFSPMLMLRLPFPYVQPYVGAGPSVNASRMKVEALGSDDEEWGYGLGYDLRGGVRLGSADSNWGLYAEFRRYEYNGNYGSEVDMDGVGTNSFIVGLSFPIGGIGYNQYADKDNQAKYGNK